MTMSAELRESPRAAIRGWLDGTKGESLTPRSRREEARPDRNHHSNEANCRFKIHEPRKKRTALERAAASKAEDPSHRGNKRHASIEGHAQISQHEHARESRSRSRGVRHTAPTSNDRGLAEKLGLHAPFRTFKDKSEDEDVNLHSLNRPRKRKRRESTGSYLEPAEIHEQTKPRSDSSSVERAVKQSSRHLQADGISENSALTRTVLERAAASFERRPRHKTREDRYELKDDKNNNRKSTKAKAKAKEHVGGEKKDKKHRRKEKSGAALMHDFTAHNVSHERLTLPPAKTLGLFGRGRASSPVRRRGLPDLAFSEMSFLNARRSKPEETAVLDNPMPAGKSKRRKTTKAADTEAEISRYFTSAKDTDRNVPQRQHEQPELASRRRSQTRDIPPDFINLPGTPFLGFGSCGASSLSPTKRLTSPEMRDLERRVTGSASRSTSYYTWSESGVPSSVPSRHGKHTVLPMESSRLLNRSKRPLTRHEAETSRSTLSPICAGKKPFQEDRVRITPERVHGSEAVDQEGQSSRSVARDIAGTDHQVYEQARENIALPVGCDSQRFVKEDSQRIGPDEGQALPNDTAFPFPVGSKPSFSDERMEKAVVYPRLSDLGFGKGASSLDATIEALLNDTRPTGPGSQDVAPWSPNPEPQSMGYVDIENRDRIRHWPRTASSGPGSLPKGVLNSEADRFFPSMRSRTEHVKPQSRRSHESELPRPQNLERPTPGFSQNFLSPHDPIKYAMNPPQRPHSRGIDLRSAWNGYGDIYEGQNSAPPIADHDHQYWTDRVQCNERGYDMPDDPLPPSLDHPVGCIDEYEDPELYERQMMSSFIIPAAEEKAYRGNDAWDDAVEDLIALDDAPYPDVHHAQAYENNRQVRDSVQQSQHSTRPVREPGRSINSHFDVGSHEIGRGFVEHPRQALSIPEETAPSRFWTPQKLY